MRWTNRELGIWELCRTRVLAIRGTTPRNAGVWTLDVDLGVKIDRPGMWLSTGKHWGFTLWLDGDRYAQLYRVPRPGSCRCWGCTGARVTSEPPRGGWEWARYGRRRD